jgi:hypothetical protein
MLRPFTESDVKVFNRAKLNRIPVWIDYDDNFMTLPAGNPARSNYHESDEHIYACVSYMLKNADAVSVSTDYIATDFEKIRGRTVDLIPNAFDSEYFRPEFKKPPSKLIVWRGSETHDADLYHFKDEIIRAATISPEWEWLFIGGNYPFFLDSIKNLRYMRKMDLVTYFDYIQKLNHAIQIVPLMATPFNFGKSNIAAQESALSGAACLAPNWNEWNIPGVVHYDSKNGFLDSLNGFIKLYENSPETFRKDDSLRFCKEELALRQINLRRASIIKRLNASCVKQ